LEWRLLGIEATSSHRFDAAFAKLLWPFVRILHFDVLFLAEVYGWRNKLGGWVIVVPPNDSSGLRRPKNVIGTKVACSTRMMCTFGFLEKFSNCGKVYKKCQK